MKAYVVHSESQFDTPDLEGGNLIDALVGDIKTLHLQALLASHPPRHFSFQSCLSFSVFAQGLLFYAFTFMVSTHREREGSPTQTESGARQETVNGGLGLIP